LCIVYCALCTVHCVLCIVIIVKGVVGKERRNIVKTQLIFSFIGFGQMYWTESVHHHGLNTRYIASIVKGVVEKEIRNISRNTTYILIHRLWPNVLD